MSSTFCPLPWVHLVTHPDGSVSLCCKADLIGKTGFSMNRFSSWEEFWKLGQVHPIVIHNSDIS